MSPSEYKRNKRRRKERVKETHKWMGGFIKLPLFSSSLEWHHSGISAISQPLAETQFIHKAWTAASTQMMQWYEQSRQPDPTNKGQYAFYQANWTINSLKELKSGCVSLWGKEWIQMKKGGLCVKGYLKLDFGKIQNTFFFFDWEKNRNKSISHPRLHQHELLDFCNRLT